MNILIVGAMESEIKFIKEQLNNIEEKNICGFIFYNGKYNNKNIILVKSGIGRTMAGLLMGVAKSNFDFDYVINVGVAGGAKPCELGDIVIGQNYVYGDVDLSSGGFGYSFGQMANCPRIFESKINLDLLKTEDCRIGDICTCDSFTTSEEVVNYIREVHYNDLNILCFDMESTVFAQACYYFDIPYVAVRSISDVIGGKYQAEDYKNNVDSSAIKVNKFILNVLNNLQ